MSALLPGPATPAGATPSAHGLTPPESVSLVPRASAGTTGTPAAATDFLSGRGAHRGGLGAPTGGPPAGQHATGGGAPLAPPGGAGLGFSFSGGAGALHAGPSDPPLSPEYRGEGSSE